MAPNYAEQFRNRFFCDSSSCRDGPGSTATPAGPTVLISGQSARCPRPNGTRTEARVTCSFSRPSQRCSADWVSFGGLGPTSRVCAQNGQRTKRAILVTHNSDDGRYSNSEICRTSDLRRRPCSLRGHIFADRHALDHPHTTASASPTDRDAAAIKPKSVRHADPA